MSMYNMIETDSITKYFGTLAAVNKVSFQVAEGEIYGFLGLNGAGKTTMFRMLLGMIKPSEGCAFIDGQRVSAGNYKLWENIGYLVETPNAYPDLSVYENLEITRKLRNLKDRQVTKNIIDRLELTAHADKKARDLSLGNAQRLGIAKALMHRPRILILDEPTNGLDPVGIVEIRNLLKDLAANHGVTILISSHLLSEISKTANRIGIIHEGKLISTFDAGEFEHLRKKEVVVDTVDNQRALAILRDGGYQAALEGASLICADEKAVIHPEKIAELLVNGGCPPKLLSIDAEDLESYFLRIVEQKEG
jgi:ABC-2 type transport system ATP-binding protein